jgi:hypothetical protein
MNFANDPGHVVEADRAHVWHHISQHKAYETIDPRIIVEGRGLRVWDIKGKEHVDAVSGGVWTVNIGYGRDELAEAIAELHSTVVSVKLVSRQGRPYLKSGPILSDVEREPDSLDDAEIRFEFSPAMRRVIADSTHWASISRRAVLTFESRYSLRLYLWLSLRANLRKTSEDVSLDDLRDLLGVPEKTLTRWQDMRRFVLDRALAEINHVAGFHASYMPLKQGRRIAGVRLAWGLKDRVELVKAQKELDRPRIGRKARRTGLVETIAQERHRLAESLANAPTLDRTRPDHLGRHEPDQKPPTPDGERDA